MQQNTFIKMIRKNNQRATSNTVFHILNEMRKNPVFKKDKLTYSHPLQLEEKGKMRADISRKISSNKSRLKKHRSALKKLQQEGSDINAIEKKKKNIKNTEAKIKVLEKEKEQTVDRRKFQIHYSHVEVIFEITNTKNLKNKEYLKDLNEAGIAFLEDRFAGADIKVSVGHLDQGGNPHCHVILEYGNGYNLTKDLNYRYGKKKKQYSDLQVDFNEYMKNHSIVKKYGFDLDDIVRGGCKEYVSLDKYKKLTKEVNAQAKKEVNKLFKKLVYHNFGLIKIPTIASIKKVRQALYKTIRTTLVNAKLPSILNDLLKKNEVLENRNELYEIKVSSLEQDLKEAKREFKTKTLEIAKLEKIGNLKSKELETKIQVTDELNKNIIELQQRLFKVENKNIEK